MLRWALMTLAGVGMILFALVAQLCAVVICAAGDPTLIVCSLVVGNSAATAMLVVWCRYTDEQMRKSFFRREMGRGPTNST
jgi:hypothetical protein